MPEAARFVGIDVSKRHLDVGLRPDGIVRRFAAEELDPLVAFLVDQRPTLVVLEATGGLEFAAAAALVAAGIPVAIVNPRQVRDFAAAARRALAAGFEVLELHCAYGYLLSSFLSPLTNRRTDDYGGSRENRMRLPLEIARELRTIWPEDKPLFVRISAVDGSREGVSIDDSVAFARELSRIGVDVVDCSSGGVGRVYEHPSGYGHQVPYAERIRRETGLKTMAVGMIVDPRQAEAIVRQGQADLVAIGREALRNPNFALHAEQALGAANPEIPFDSWPPQISWWLNGRERKIRRPGPWSPAEEFAA